MSGSIPASAIVQVTPNVISAGGTALDMNGVLLTASTRVPIGNVMGFPSVAAVSAYFGPTALETSLAGVYFAGFDNSNVKPGNMFIVQYPWTAPVSAYLRGGNISALTLTQLQALSGSITVSIDGSPVTAASISFSAATSFSNAAQLIQTGLGISGPETASFTGAIATTTLTVSALASGAIHIGDAVVGAGVTALTTITAFGTGTGGVGTYTISTSQTVASEAMTTETPGVLYDTTSGAFTITSATSGPSSAIGFATGTLAVPLLLTQQTGAVTSQGAAIAVPATAMAAIVNQTTDWVSFTTAFEPVDADKEAFATWCNQQANRYIYAMWSSNILDTESGNPSPPVAFINNGDLSGIEMIYCNPSVDTAGNLAVFEMGAFASIDFTETQGRTTMAFRSQAGLAAQVTDQTSAANLVAYGMNFYGRYATANDDFVFFYPGAVSGPFRWVDSYINQIWLNNQFQLTLMGLLVAMKSIPYNAAGYAMIEQALSDPIQAALNFGAIQPGVTLSSTQIVEVNTAAGRKIDTTLSQRGWYLQILDATPQVRAARGSPPMTFWYMDGGSVQKMSLASVEVQ